MNLLTVLLLFTAFLITRVSSLRLGIQILLVQSIAVAVACVWSGIESEAFHTYIAALLTVIIKSPIRKTANAPDNISLLNPGNASSISP